MRVFYPHGLIPCDGNGQKQSKYNRKHEQGRKAQRTKCHKRNNHIRILFQKDRFITQSNYISIKIGETIYTFRAIWTIISDLCSLISEIIGDSSTLITEKTRCHLQYFFVITFCLFHTLQ